jgi:hypothetical protein
MVAAYLVPALRHHNTQELALHFLQHWTYWTAPMGDGQSGWLLQDSKKADLSAAKLPNYNGDNAEL